MPVRIQRRRAKGWRMPADTIYVGRPTKWGNPFVPGTRGRTVKECVDLYQAIASGYLCVSVEQPLIAPQERLLKSVQHDLGELRGKNLACFCRLDRPCHADILLALANGEPLPSLTLERIS